MVFVMVGAKHGAACSIFTPKLWRSSRPPPCTGAWSEERRWLGAAEGLPRAGAPEAAPTHWFVGGEFGVGWRRPPAPCLVSLRQMTVDGLPASFMLQGMRGGRLCLPSPCALRGLRIGASLVQRLPLGRSRRR